MKPKDARIAIILVLVLCSGLIFIFPTEPVLNTNVLFDDKVDERIENEKVSKDNTNLILIITLLCAKYLGDYLVIYMSYGVSIAGFIQMIFLIFTLKKIYKPQFKVNLNADNKAKSFFKKVLPSIFCMGRRMVLKKRSV